MVASLSITKYIVHVDERHCTLAALRVLYELVDLRQEQMINHAHTATCTCSIDVHNVYMSQSHAHRTYIHAMSINTVVNSYPHLFQVYPSGHGEVGSSLLPPSCFVTCSSDNTTRFWCLDGEGAWSIKNQYSKVTIKLCIPL